MNILKGSILVVIASASIYFLYQISSTDKITDAVAYDKFLSVSTDAKVDEINSNIDFWEDKLNTNPDQFPYKAKLAYYNSELFATNGDIRKLKLSEQYLVDVNTSTNYSNAAYLRALARNYITQHRFSEALHNLEIAEKNGERLEATQKMLFDVHLELGNDSKAEGYLSKFENLRDFEYLIRRSKWMDHEGDLESAIYLMEEAKKKIEEGNNEDLKQWTYTNLADYYGHAGRIADSYDHYIKALEIDPTNAYAKKGIAWIVFSHERNSDEALRIINHITREHYAPDYHLLKAEIAEFNGELLVKAKELQLFFDKTESDAYGVMYNAHKAALLAEEFNNYSMAEKLAQMEIDSRPTPQSFSLLAWTYFNSGDLDSAFEIIEEKVANKTFEPTIQYQMAEIYKAKGDNKRVAKLREELEGSIYELGPSMEDKIEKL
ncbi:MAG: cell surface protein [Chitinophagales bacterium]|nr:cell surface protein [Chitinophagales bacterium]